MPLSPHIGINLFGKLGPLDGIRRIARAGDDAIDYSAIGRLAMPGTPLLAALEGVRFTGMLLLEGGPHLPGGDVDTLLAAHRRGFRAALADYSSSPLGG